MYFLPITRNGTRVWSEVIVLLFNKRKRAIHDYIAGTVVILKEFAVQDSEVQ